MGGAALEPLDALTAAADGLVAAGRRPALVGIAGGVAAGKSTLAADLAARLQRGGRRVEVLCTDAFLLPNAELDRRGLSMRKGFPESFDATALEEALDALRRGGAVEVPVYSHAVYDRLPGAARVVAAAEVVIVEGVNVLQEGVAARLDLPVYLDATEEALRGWFSARFLELCAAADAGTDEGAASFYAMFRGMTDEARAAVAGHVWSDVNAVNLREHILPTRARAALVLRKAADHRLVGLDVPG